MNKTSESDKKTFIQLWAEFFELSEGSYEDKKAAAWREIKKYPEYAECDKEYRAYYNAHNKGLRGKPSFEGANDKARKWESYLQVVASWAYVYRIKNGLQTSKPLVKHDQASFIDQNKEKDKNVTLNGNDKSDFKTRYKRVVDKFGYVPSDEICNILGNVTESVSRTYRIQLTRDGYKFEAAERGGFKVVERPKHAPLLIPTPYEAVMKKLAAMEKKLAEYEAKEKADQEKIASVRALLG
jgi:hypothetical protein